MGRQGTSLAFPGGGIVGTRRAIPLRGFRYWRTAPRMAWKCLCWDRLRACL